MDLSELPKYNEQELEDRIESILNRDYSLEKKRKVLRQIVGFIDLTSLNGTDNEEKIELLSDKAWQHTNEDTSIPPVAAVCVYPAFIKTAKNRLNGRDIKVATVAADFPTGQLPFFLKEAEVRYAFGQNADEIDIVISRGKLISSHFDEVKEEISKIREIVKEISLKVIIESGELIDYRNVAIASDIAMHAGADFIKTSTGKISVGATYEDVLVMAERIKVFFEQTGKRVGIKPSGGISKAKHALHYYKIIEEILGEEWLDKKLFRFGASSLLDKLLKKIHKYE